jgi:hypothetical protein
MKFYIPEIKIGQIVEGTVEEVISSQYLIINFYGDLIRAKNSTQRHFQKGDSIRLEVTGLNPLEFQVPVYRAHPSRLFEKRV